MTRYRDDWEEDDEVDSYGNATYGVARGPGGTLWTLQADRVVRRNESPGAEAEVRLDGRAGENDSTTEYADLLSVGRWVVLCDGQLGSVDEQWNRTDDAARRQPLVPNGTTGMTATDDALVLVTGNWTVYAFGRSKGPWSAVNSLTTVVRRRGSD